MIFKKFLSSFFNPYIGPIFVVGIVIFVIFTIVLPKFSYENKTANMTNNAIETIENLKKIRSYYTKNIINNIKSIEQVNINYNYENNKSTIPLPATLIHDLSEFLPKDDMKIQMYSKYPFPNRKDRVLSSFQEESLSYFLKNPSKIYTKVEKLGEEKILKVAVSDIFMDQSCVNCHNTRSDTPKNDWNLGDVRGAISINIVYDDTLSLSSKQTMILTIVFVILLIILIIHYLVIFFQKKKEHKLNSELLEQKVQERTKSLNEINTVLNQYKNAVDCSAIVSKSDTKGRITYLNDEFIKISGYSKEELLGKSHSIIRHEDMPSSVFNELWETVSSKKIWKGIIKNKTKNGKAYYVSSTIVPIINYENEIEEYLAIRFNITDLVEAKLQAQSANEAKTTFLANMSHEIRTPLNAIIGFSDVLNSSKNLDEKEKKFTSIIKSSANSLLEIINDILDISKIQSGNFEIALDRTSIKDIVVEVYELFSKKADEKSIKFNLNIDEDAQVIVNTDSTRLRQVLSNLISNAIKFTNNGGNIDFNLLLKNKKENNRVLRFEVIDNGIGIPENKVDKIFKPFVQVDNKSNRKFEGTGLGLSICSYIVKALGSKLEVETKIGKGSKFFFDIEFMVFKEKSEKTKIKEVKNHKYNAKVLIAEDNKTNQELISYFMGDFNIEYKIMSNGKELLEEFKKDENYDLILMDINMPIMDGVDACKNIREYEKVNNLKNIPIVALTANAIKGDKEKFLEMGMDDYLSKPLNVNKLREVLDKYLKIKQSSKQNINDLRKVNDEEKKDNIIDEKLVSKNLGISENIAQLIIKKFKDNIEKDLFELKEFIDLNEEEKISNKISLIKKLCLNIGLNNLSDILEQMEEKITKKDEILKLYEKLVLEIKELL